MWCRKSSARAMSTQWKMVRTHEVKKKKKQKQKKKKKKKRKQDK